MKKVFVDVKKELASEFKASCAKLGVTQAEVLKEAIYDTISRAKK